MPPNQVSERFQRFLARIEPTDRELEKATRRVGDIRTRLERNFVVKRFLTVGSHWKGTAVRRYSDVDVFVVLSRDEARKWSPELTSTTLLNRIRNDLRKRYTQTTVRKDKQAAVVRFEQGAHAIDVVPAIFYSFEAQPSAPAYLIPDGEGDWLITAPDIQRKYLEQEHSRSGRKLKSLVKMLKWWSQSRTATYPLTSLYIEHFLAWCQIPVSCTYQEALAFCFGMLAKHRCPPIEDPMGVSDVPFRAAHTTTQIRAVTHAADQSFGRANRAIAQAAKGNWRTALQAWSLVFNRRFP